MQEYLKVPQAAELLGISPKAAWQHIYRGEIPFRRWGRRILGRGEKTERVDAFYEVRDVTKWTPPQAEYWWEHLPSGDDAAWQQRASRRTQQDQIRLAFVCRKFRWGEEPPPFVIEIDFTTTPWSLQDVTAEISASGAQAAQETRQAQETLFLDAAMALTATIDERGSDAPMGKTDAVDFLYAMGLKRAQARNLLEACNADIHPAEGRWVLRSIPGMRGKIGVYLPEWCVIDGNLSRQARTPAPENEDTTPQACRPHEDCTASSRHVKNVEKSTTSEQAKLAVKLGSQR